MLEGQVELPDHISKLIRDHLSQFGLENVKFLIESGSKNGDSYSGDIYRLIVQSYDRNVEGGANDSSSPYAVLLADKCYHQFILKTSPQSELRRAVYKSTIYFAREHYTYLKVLPAFEAFQLDYLEKSEIFNNYPKMLSGSLNPCNEYVLMEDMSTYGFKNFDRPVPLSFNKCAAILKVLARLHAVSFAYKDQCPEEFFKLTEPLEDVVFKNPVDEQFDQFLRRRVDCALTALTENDEEVKQRILAFQKIFSKSMVECVDQKDDAVILHGDCWISNILHRDNNADLDSDINFLDWQICRYGTPVIDISYFIFCCTDSQLRARLTELLQIYHSSLSERITVLGSDPTALFPYIKLEEHMKNYAKFGLGMALMTLHTTSCDPKEMPSITEHLDCSDFLKLNAISDLLSKKDPYLKRMAEVCRDVVNLGFI